MTGALAKTTIAFALVGCGRLEFEHAIDAATPDALDPTGVLAHWPLDEPAGATTFTDVSGFGNTGDCTACPTLGVPGVHGTAISFASGKAGIHVTSGEALRALSASFTVAAWVRIVDVQTYGVILSNARDCCGLYNGFQFLVSHYSNGPALQSWAGDVVGLALAPPPPLDTWIHVAATFDGAVNRVFVDGVVVASADSGAPALPASFDLWIGAMGYQAPDYPLINGSIDDVWIIGRALDASEILQVRAGTFP